MRGFFSIAGVITAILISVSAFFTAAVAQTSGCGITVNAGLDVITCQAGQSTNLSGTITGTILSAAWSPTQGVANPANLSTSATVDQTTTYRLTARTLSPVNAITNGDFSQGNVSFTTDYQFNNTDVRTEGRYAVVPNGRNVHNSFASCGDHTGGGNMMVVNASGVSNNVWCQTISVNPNSDYQFAAWAASMVSQNPAQLQFSINGVLIGNVFTAPSQTCQWREFTATWNADAAATAQICIANVNNTPAGNDFAIDDISFREICQVSDEVTVTVANLDAGWSAPGSLCQNSIAIDLNTLLNTTATSGGSWLIDGTVASTLNPASLALGNHTIRYTVTLGSCTEQNEQTIAIVAAPNAGIAAAPERLCSGENQSFNLADLVNGEDPGGTWSETSAVPSTAGAFNATTGAFNAANQSAGTYTFKYTIEATACPDAEVTVTIIIEPSPVANAGEDMELNCAIEMVTIGGTNTSSGPNIQHQWAARGGSAIVNPNIPLTEVESADTYVLTVSNTQNGCSAMDEVVVTARITTPELSVETKPVSCNSTNDGGIQVTAVTNGDAPFEYAITGLAFSAKNQFEFLTPGTYTVTARDANGCEGSATITIAQPEALDVEILSDLSGDPPSLIRGDSTSLQLLFSKPESDIVSITWSPDSLSCANCTSLTVKPSIATTYTVRVTDIAGCRASDDITIFVQKVQRIFIPNAFSPNGDGNNDVFYISAGAGVESIKSLRILNRWGTMVFSREGFQPNDPTFGWDGSFNGERLPGNVYVVVAEIKMTDGTIVVEKGDVILVK